MGSGLDVAKSHRVSGRQNPGAEVSWVLGLGSRFLVPRYNQEQLFHLPFRLKRASAFPVFRFR